MRLVGSVNQVPGANHLSLRTKRFQLAAEEFDIDLDVLPQTFLAARSRRSCQKRRAFPSWLTDVAVAWSLFAGWSFMMHPTPFLQGFRQAKAASRQSHPNYGETMAPSCHARLSNSI